MRGCSCKMQSGELYVQLPGFEDLYAQHSSTTAAGGSSCSLIRLDFAAARE
jgi:hypothetical protein